MSIEATVQRVGEIRNMLLGKPATPATASSASSAPFTAALLNAMSNTPASAASSDSSFGGLAYDAEIQSSAAREGVDPALIRAVIAHESGGNAAATSAAGAQGLMQLMPTTAAGLGVTNPYDPAQSIAGGARLLRTLLDRYHGNLTSAIAAYNAGPGAVDRFGGVPPYAETQAYVRNVLGTYQGTTTERTIT